MAKKISLEEYSKKQSNKKTSLILIAILIMIGVVAIVSIILYRNSEKENQHYKRCIEDAITELNKAHVEYYHQEGVFEGYPPADVEATNRKISEFIVDLNKCVEKK